MIKDVFFFHEKKCYLKGHCRSILCKIRENFMNNFCPYFTFYDDILYLEDVHRDHHQFL